MEEAVLSMFTVDMEVIMALVFIFIIAAFLGVELISKVPSQLHTPLMSGTNATAFNTAEAFSGFGAASIIGIILGTIAIVFATINVMGGYFVTDRMLGMFKKKGDK